MENYTNHIQEFIKKSEQNPKIIYTKKGYVINNGTPFKVKQPFYFFVVIIASMANFKTKLFSKQTKP